MRILMMDDEPNPLSTTSARLEEVGVEVCTAGNGGEALRLLADPEQFDVLFADVVMPGMSGVDLAHEARRRHGGLSVILTSAYTPPTTKIPHN